MTAQVMKRDSKRFLWVTFLITAYVSVVALISALACFVHERYCNDCGPTDPIGHVVLGFIVAGTLVVRAAVAYHRWSSACRIANEIRCEVLRIIYRLRSESTKTKAEAFSCIRMCVVYTIRELSTSAHDIVSESNTEDFLQAVARLEILVPSWAMKSVSQIRLAYSDGLMLRDGLITPLLRWPVFISMTIFTWSTPFVLSSHLGWWDVPVSSMVAFGFYVLYQIASEMIEPFNTEVSYFVNTSFPLEAVLSSVNMAILKLGSDAGVTTSDALPEDPSSTATESLYHPEKLETSKNLPSEGSISSSEMGGLGLILEQADTGLQVLKITSHPLGTNSLMVGDILTKIDGVSIRHERFGLICELISGRPGSNCTVSAFRPRTNNELQFALTRVKLHCHVSDLILQSSAYHPTTRCWQTDRENFRSFLKSPVRSTINNVNPDSAATHLSRSSASMFYESINARSSGLGNMDNERLVLGQQRQELLEKYCGRLDGTLRSASDGIGVFRLENSIRARRGELTPEDSSNLPAVEQECACQKPQDSSLPIQREKDPLSNTSNFLEPEAAASESAESSLLSTMSIEDRGDEAMDDEAQTETGSFHGKESDGQKDSNWQMPTLKRNDPVNHQKGMREDTSSDDFSDTASVSNGNLWARENKFSFEDSLKPSHSASQAQDRSEASHGAANHSTDLKDKGNQYGTERGDHSQKVKQVVIQEPPAGGQIRRDPNSYKPDVLFFDHEGRTNSPNLDSTMFPEVFPDGSDIDNDTAEHAGLDNSTRRKTIRQSLHSTQMQERKLPETHSVIDLEDSAGPAKLAVHLQSAWSESSEEDTESERARVSSDIQISVALNGAISESLSSKITFQEMENLWLQEPSSSL